MRVTYCGTILEYDRRARCNSTLTGLAVNAVGLLVLVVVGSRLNTVVTVPSIENSHYVLIAPTLEPEPKPAPLPAPVLPQVAKLETPKLPTPPIEPPRVIKTRPPEPPVLAKVEPKKPVLPEVAAAAPTTIPPKPKAPVDIQIKTNVFGAAGSQVATVQEPPRRVQSKVQSKVQTGGFGDPNGVPGHGDPNRNTVTVASVGSFELPSGPGNGNGTAGSRGVSGIIRSAGFSDGTSSSGPHGYGNGGAVVSSGFGDSAAQLTPAVARVEKKPALQPVEILYKPRPTYTAEALQQKVEGEVLLDVVFSANGELRIQRVVKGLGYGLDDMARAAAEQIKFHPARRDGQPYDCAALVHIVFELAR